MSRGKTAAEVTDQSRTGGILVCLVDQHPLASLYLEGALHHHRDMKVMISRGPHAGGGAGGGRCVLVFDKVRLPCPAAGQLYLAKGGARGAKILLVGGELSAEEACRLLFLGVHGFVAYGAVTADLASAVRALAMGELWFPSDVIRRFAQSAPVLRSSEAALGGFTEREWEVIGLLQRRLADKEIAAALHISERTVRYHLTEIFRKSGLRDRHSVTEYVRTGACLASAGGSPPLSPRVAHEKSLAARRAPA